MSLCMVKMVRYERKVHSCVRCGNIYTCTSPAVCTFARETPDCPKCYQGPPYKQQEERARHMTQLRPESAPIISNAVQSGLMSDTGFACPKCDYVFPSAEQVAEHLRNEHTDGAQTETSKRTV
jgi:predicted  nucleic acid-binding Zn-ribbon protein